MEQAPRRRPSIRRSCRAPRAPRSGARPTAPKALLLLRFAEQEHGPVGPRTRPRAALLGLLRKPCGPVGRFCRTGCTRGSRLLRSLEKKNSLFSAPLKEPLTKPGRVLSFAEQSAALGSSVLKVKQSPRCSKSLLQNRSPCLALCFRRVSLTGRLGLAQLS